MIEQFVNDVRLMRYWQKAFFKSEARSAERQEALEQSRVYERAVDRHLRSLAGPGAEAQAGLEL